MGDTPTVLVLDDDESIRVMLKESLTRAGFEVAAHENPEQVLGAALEERFDVIVTDFIMDPITGLEFVKTLRDKGVRTPVILITASFHPGLNNAAKKLDIEEMIAKPFRGEDVARKVKAVLKKRQGDPANC